MRLAGTSVWLFCGVLLAGASGALAEIHVAGVSVGTSHTIIAGDLIDFDSVAVHMTAPGALTMTGGEVSAANVTGSGIYMLGGSFDMTGGNLGGGTGTGSGLHIRGGEATIGGSATLRGGTDPGSTGSGMHIDAGAVTVNGGTFNGGGVTGSAVNIRGGQLDIFGGDFHDAVAVNGGETTIHGSAFSINGAPVTAPLPYLVTASSGAIDVTYLGGLTETIAFNHFNPNNGTLTLAPEPATLSLLALGGLSILRRRRGGGKKRRT